ncbi:NAD(P)/FAD-dependent oxidoreductase [Pseudomonas sp. efr-133-TYG-103a]|uniref:NAD(P)/FAD-dependent oxidoreductase n=1 Tax=Pseudomonas sp. efr-133-TYG-103a TaxID=3040308 RepID=UPI0025574284|nr:FAD-dependent oxidoreductase [Pseudomonas sp. efr-133-TYG-103a]
MAHSITNGTPHLRVHGVASSAKAYEIRDFLSRSVVEYDWIELNASSAQTVPGIDTLNDPRLPACEFPDGSWLFSANLHDVAHKLGWVRSPKRKEYDVSIYGAGPAGLSAAVYAASEGLKTVLIERHAVGGQAGSSSLIENYMGFPNGIGGRELAERARQQAVRFGAEILHLKEGVNANFVDDKIVVDLEDGGRIIAKSNICATGVEWRRLNIPDETRFLGCGLFYGAGFSEAPMCAGERVFVIGGGNSAGQAAVHFSQYARDVIMLVRRSDLGEQLSDYLVKKIRATHNIQVKTNSEVVTLEGGSRVESITVRNNLTAETNDVETHHVFACIGGHPNTSWALHTHILRDPHGYLVTGNDLLRDGKLPDTWPLSRLPFHLETSVPGSFAVGDVRHGSIKRVATAVGEGAMAVAFVHQHLAQT